MYVFNGDFVDRGAWGLETLILLTCLKLALPNHVILLRGNHETVTCTMMYGFKGELMAKYGHKHWKVVQMACKKMFAQLPLSAVINGKTLVLHGGLFRKPVQRTTGKNKRKSKPYLLLTVDVH
jgi:serine/threonine-protein phosphatase 5